MAVIFVRVLLNLHGITNLRITVSVILVGFYLIYMVLQILRITVSVIFVRVLLNLHGITNFENYCICDFSWVLLNLHGIANFENYCICDFCWVLLNLHGIYFFLELLYIFACNS